MKNRQITIIGTGALGRTLAKAFFEKNMTVYSLFNRSQGPLRLLSKTVQPVFSATFPEDIEQVGDVIFITTSDNVIDKVANGLAGLSNDYSNKIIVHCSGSRPSSVLSALQKKGAAVAAFHPNQTFTAHSKPKDFNHIYFDIEGDERAVAVLEKVSRILNAHYFQITAKAKPYLHAAGVTASNYLVALLSLSASIAEKGGIERKKAISALMPLTQKTLDNAKKAANLEEAVSGPIVRGDVETVAGHIKLLESIPEIRRLYKLLGQLVLEIVQNGEKESDETRQTLIKILQDER